MNNKKGVFRLLSFFTIFALLIVSFSILPAGVLTTSAKTLGDGEGLVVYDRMSGGSSGTPSNSGFGWTGNYNLGGAGTVSWGNLASAFAYDGVTTTGQSYGYLNMTWDATLRRHFKKIDATVQPVWISFLWHTEPTANKEANSFSFRFYDGDTTAATTPVNVFAAKMRKPDGASTSRMIMQNGANSTTAVSANEADTLMENSNGVTFVLMKLDGENKKVTTYVNPLFNGRAASEGVTELPALNYTSEANALASLNAQYGGETGRPNPTDLTVTAPLIIDAFTVNPNNSTRLAEFRIGFDLLSVIDYTRITEGKSQTEKPDFIMESEYDIINESERTITGYGSGTVADFLELFEIDLAEYKVLTGPGGSEVDSSKQVAEGMVLEITPDDIGAKIAEYTLGAPVKIKSAGIYAGGELVKAITAGETTAKAEIYSAMPYPATLSLTYSDGTNPSVTKTFVRSDETKTTYLETASVGIVQGVSSEALAMTLKDESGNGLIKPIVYSDKAASSTSIEVLVLQPNGGSASVTTINETDPRIIYTTATNTNSTGWARSNAPDAYAGINATEGITTDNEKLAEGLGGDTAPYPVLTLKQGAYVTFQPVAAQGILQGNYDIYFFNPRRTGASADKGDPKIKFSYNAGSGEKDLTVFNQNNDSTRQMWNKLNTEPILFENTVNDWVRLTRTNTDSTTTTGEYTRIGAILFVKVSDLTTIKPAEFTNSGGTSITTLGSEESVTVNFDLDSKNLMNKTPVAVVVAAYGEHDLLDCKVKIIDDISASSILVEGKISETIDVDGNVRKVRAFLIEDFGALRPITGMANEIVRPNLD